MSTELVIALMALGVSLGTAVVLLSRPSPGCHCRIDVPDALSVPLWGIEHALNRVAMSIDRHTNHMPDAQADRAQQHAMRLSRMLNDAGKP